MISLLSPAKTLDFETPDKIAETTIPQFHTDSNRLVRILKKKSVDDIKGLMSISDALAKLNKDRFKNYSKEFTKDNSKSAITAFRGDVYLGLDATTLSNEDLEFANDHVRILSGLYGILMPFDRIQPYRLEMGTKLENKQGTNLYHYWGDKLSKALNNELESAGSNTIVNLASNEYFKAANTKKLNAKVINIAFREEDNGELKFKSFFAKKARGLMVRYIVQNRIDEVELLKGFDLENYRFAEEHSTTDHLFFIR